MKTRNTLLIALGAVVVIAACATVPPSNNQSALVAEAKIRTAWFEHRVTGLSDQINKSGGFIIFPDVAKFGVLYGGGTFGRGVVCTADGRQVGWAALNTGSLGLQAGVEGFKLLVVLQDKGMLDMLTRSQLTGSVAATLVAAEKGAAVTVPFHEGVAVYEGANKGLFAGIDFGLNLIRYEPLAPGYAGKDLR